jgi:predicted amidohydrolase
MNIACIQYPILLGDLEKNFEVFLPQVNQISSQIEALIVLPEMWVSGFDYDNLKSIAQKTDYLCNEIASNLKNNSIAIASMAEMEDDKIFNTVFAIDSNNVIAKYRKNFLFSPMKEDQYFSKGNEICLFKHKGVNISLHTCYEIRFPEMFRMAAYRGSELMIVPAIWPSQKVEHWLTLLRARAIENQCFVVGCNTSSMFTSKKEIVCGFSSVYSPWGELVVSAQKEETVIECNIEINKVKEVRETIPSLKDSINSFKIQKL